MIDLERAEDEAYERLLGRIQEVFGPEIHSRAYNKTLEAILNTMIAHAIDRSGGCDGRRADCCCQAAGADDFNGQRGRHGGLGRPGRWPHSSGCCPCCHQGRCCWLHSPGSSDSSSSGGTCRRRLAIGKLQAVLAV